MDLADQDLLIHIHKRLTDANNPLTKEDIAFITGRLEQSLKAQGILTNPEVETIERDFKFSDLLRRKR